MIYRCNSTIIFIKSMSHTGDILFTKKLGLSFISVLNITFYNHTQTIDIHLLVALETRIVIQIKLALYKELLNFFFFFNFMTTSLT